MLHPDLHQRHVWKYLIDKGKHTLFGKKFRFSSIRTLEQFRNQVPIQAYEDFFPWIQRAKNGENNVLWPGAVKWFAKSSGTTNDRSKYIPITNDNMQDCHFAGGRDMFGWYFENVPDSRLPSGKCLTIGGSHELVKEGPHARCGDLSAILLENLPFLYTLGNTPGKSVALMGNYEQKLEKMLELLPQLSISSVAGVPTWTLILMQKLLERTGSKFLTDIWPQFEAFFHGGVSFTPYRNLFQEMAPNLRFFEIYNASEGYIAFQNDLSESSLLMLLNHGMFFEFVPVSEIESECPQAMGIEDLEKGKVYALVLSTNSGLWRYMIGDTLRIESLQPLKIKIMGRTRHFINAFGEELMIENVEVALAEAMQQTGALVSDYTGAPVYLQIGQAGGHEWLMEFKRNPDSLETFVDVFDRVLMRVNTDYEAKRSANLALVRPKLHVLPSGTFYEWMKLRGKLGGQNKVPRLSNDRFYVEDILKQFHPLETY